MYSPRLAWMRCSLRPTEASGRVTQSWRRPLSAEISVWSRRHLLSARAAALEAGVVVALRRTMALDFLRVARGAFGASRLRSPAGAYRRSQRTFLHWWLHSAITKEGP